MNTQPSSVLSVCHQHCLAEVISFIFPNQWWAYWIRSIWYFLVCLWASGCVVLDSKVIARVPIKGPSVGGDASKPCLPALPWQRAPAASPACPPLVPTFPPETPVPCLHSEWSWRIRWKGDISRILCAPAFRRAAMWWREDFWCAVRDLRRCSGVAGESPKCGGLICPNGLLLFWGYLWVAVNKLSWKSLY